MKIQNRRKGVTLADSLCGLFIITLGLSLYVNINQIIHHQLMISNQHLVQERRVYENNLSKKK